MLGNSRKHPRSDFFPVVKCKDEVGMSILGQYAVRYALPLDVPADFLEGSKDTARA